MGSTIGEPDKWALKPEIAVFNRYGARSKVTLRFTNFLDSPMMLRFEARHPSGDIPFHILRLFFDLEGPRVSSSEHEDFRVGPNASISIIICYKDNAIMQGVQKIPPPSFVVSFKKDTSPWELGATIPIHYIYEPNSDSDDQKTKRVGCNQCQRPSALRYQCTECEEPSYQLCLECISRYGREAHMVRYGLSHGFEPICGAPKCGVCKEEAEEHMYSCIQCSETSSEKAMMCFRCYSDYRNLTEHSEGKSFGHSFKQTTMSPPICKPEPYLQDLHEENNPILCTSCRSIIRFESFRCLDCVKPFNLCDRCVDEGGLARHISHRFDFFVPENADDLRKD